MSKSPPKPNRRQLFRDVDYVDKLTPEEDEWLFKFEAMEKLGLGEDKERARFIERRKYKQSCDWMNVSPDKILTHIAEKNKSRKRKSKNMAGNSRFLGNKKGNENVEIIKEDIRGTDQLHEADQCPDQDHGIRTCDKNEGCSET
jgi:hypothetical protein